MKINTENQQTELRDQAFAKRITSLLDAQAINIDAKSASRLSYVRQQAIANMARPSSMGALNQNGVLRLLGDYWHQYRLVMTLMMCGLGLISIITVNNLGNNIELIVQEDADLLASDLPPEVYLNEGFGTWLSENTQR